ncbi:MAG TPA: hypothetical protein DDW81_17185 [Cryomorphaceae bacterium]|nr:hypothetical protein [Owenweeksia sp.]HBF21837.1 hypothetical protein [Cryomorphaceae bacterium]HCQ16861.1 hypothetical protein [Cryomorphaceae bacterium]|tara:strand:- start:7066 stop:9198 length:2133 start_codon:yes stop_codon:yes gene_type:complete
MFFYSSFFKTLCLGFLLVLIIVLNTVLYAQNPKEGQDMKRLNDSAWHYLDIDLDSAQYFAKKGLLSNIPKTPYQISIAHNALGTYFQRTSKYDSATYHFSKSLEIRKRLADTIPLINVYLNLGSLYYDQGNPIQAIDTLEKAVILLNTQPYQGDSLTIKSSVLNMLGVIYMETGRLSEAFEALSKSYQLRTHNGSDLDLAKSALNFGHLHELIHDYKTARKLYQFALHTYNDYGYTFKAAKCYKSLADIYMAEANYSQARQYYNRAKNIFLQEDDKQEVAGTYSSLGYLEEATGNFEEAFQDQQTALSIYSKIDDRDGMTESYNHLGQLAIKQNDLTQAIEYLTKAEGLAQQLSSAYLLTNVYDGLAKAYGQQQNYRQAFAYKMKSEKVYKKHALDLQQLVNERYQRELAEQKQQILSEKLNKEKAITRSQTLQLYILYLVGGAMLLLFFISWVNFKQKARLQKAKEKEQQRQQEINQLMQDQKVHKMDALIEGQQSERIRIAQDIHDRLGSLLSVLKIHFGEVTQQFKSIQQKTESKVSEVNTLIDQAAQAIREISQNLRSGVLDEMGLIPAIEDICQRAQDTGKIEVEVHTESVKGQLNPNLEWTIYRNTEEALNNILKHAQANKVIVQIFQGKDHISVTIEDNGVGFDPKQLKESENRQSLGLKGMKARTRKYNGSFEIDSKKNRGTIIMMDFKLQPTENYGDENKQ